MFSVKECKCLETDLDCKTLYKDLLSDGQCHDFLNNEHCGWDKDPNNDHHDWGDCCMVGPDSDSDEQKWKPDWDEHCKVNNTKIPLTT